MVDVAYENNTLTIAGDGLSDLALELIQLSPDLQFREDIQESVVSDYADALERGDILPPIDVFEIESDFLLAGGHHRLEAFRRCGRETIPARIHSGTMQDAMLFAAGQNAEHGLRRTNAEKRIAVSLILSQPEWREMSSAWVARHCRVSTPFVCRVREEWGLPPGNTVQAERNGTVYTMRTNNHRTVSAEPSPDALPDAQGESGEDSATTQGATPSVDLAESDIAIESDPSLLDVSLSVGEDTYEEDPFSPLDVMSEDFELSEECGSAQNLLRCMENALGALEQLYERMDGENSPEESRRISTWVKILAEWIARIHQGVTDA